MKIIGKYEASIDCVVFRGVADDHVVPQHVMVLTPEEFFLEYMKGSAFTPVRRTAHGAEVKFG